MLVKEGNPGIDFSADSPAASDEIRGSEGLQASRGRVSQSEQ